MIRNPPQPPHSHERFALRERKTALYLVCTDNSSLSWHKQPVWTVASMSEAITFREFALSEPAHRVRQCAWLDIEKVRVTHVVTERVSEDEIINERLLKLIRSSRLGYLATVEMEYAMRENPAVAAMRYLMVFDRSIPSDVYHEIRVIADIVVAGSVMLAAGEVDLLVVRCFENLPLRLLYDLSLGTVLSEYPPKYDTCDNDDGRHKLHPTRALARASASRDFDRRRLHGGTSADREPQ